MRPTGVEGLIEADPQSYDSDDPFLREPMLITPDRRYPGPRPSFYSFDLLADAQAVDWVHNLERHQSLKPLVEPESEDDSGPPDFVYGSKSPPLRSELV